MSFAKTVKSFLSHPGDSFDAVRGSTLREGFRYYIILLLIYSILSGVMLLAMIGTMSALFGLLLGTLTAGILMPLGALSILYIIVQAILFGLVGLFAGGAWIHLWMHIFGGREGYTQTVKALMYSYTPMGIIGWIPIVNAIAAVWYLVLSIIGLSHLQKMGYGRVIAAIVVSMVIFAAIFLLISTAYPPLQNFFLNAYITPSAS